MSTSCHRKGLAAGLFALSLGGAAVWHFTKAGPPTVAEGPPAAAAVEGRKELAAILDAGRQWHERVEAAQALPLAVDDADLEKLLAFLEAPLPAEGRDNALLALNEVMEQLRLKGRATEAYGRALSRLIRNPQADPVVRDYAVQHAVRWIMDSPHEEQQDDAPPAGRADAADRELLLESIGILLSDPGKSSGGAESSWGTALNALRELRQAVPDAADVAVAFAGVSPWVLGIATGTREAVPANRVAAIQCLPELPDRAPALAVARGLAAGGDPLASLPAIAALGAMGEATDAATLEQIAAQDARLRFAANASLKRLHSRLSAPDQP